MRDEKERARAEQEVREALLKKERDDKEKDVAPVAGSQGTYSVRVQTGVEAMMFE